MLFLTTKFLVIYTIECEKKKSVRINFHTAKPKPDSIHTSKKLVIIITIIKEAYLRTPTSRHGAAAVVRKHYLKTITHNES